MNMLSSNEIRDRERTRSARRIRRGPRYGRRSQPRRARTRRSPKTSATNPSVSRRAWSSRAQTRLLRSRPSRSPAQTGRRYCEREKIRVHRYPPLALGITGRGRVCRSGNDTPMSSANRCKNSAKSPIETIFARRTRKGARRESQPGGQNDTLGGWKIDDGRRCGTTEASSR